MIGELKPKHIEPMFIANVENNGFIHKMLESNGLHFRWNSWVLCEVCCHETNPIHHVICTDFCYVRLDKVTVTRWNPTYEDYEHKENVDLKSFHYWRPIQVVLLKG